ncbi:MAG: YiiD C-terminal domain-containing protein [Cellvibrionaceae bacterium]
MSKIAEAIKSIDTLKHMGLEILESNDNRVRIRMPKEGNTNHLGGVYAGAIFTLAEFPFGMMYIAKLGMTEMVPVVGEMTIRYLAPATDDLFIDVEVSDEEWTTIVEDTREKGKLKLVREIEVKDAQGNVNSVVKATYFSLLLPK